MCVVAGFQADYYVRLSLEDILYPDEITSNNENAQLKKLVTEHYNAYKANYSGNIDFDVDAGS